MDTTAINPNCKKCGLPFKPRTGMYTLDGDDGPYHANCLPASPKAKDGRETLQERLRRSTARMANECSVRLDLWCEHSSVCLQLANDHDAAQAEIARLTAKYEPGHTDLMVLPESLDAFLAENPLPEDPTPLPVAEDVVAKAADILAQRQYERERRSVGVQEATPEQLANTPTQVWGAYYNNAYEDVQAIASLLRQPKVAPEGVIRLTPAEIQSGHDRVKWAEGLIRQLPEDHDGRNSWLLNYASAPTPASAVASEALNRAPTEQERQQIIGSGRDAGLEEAAKICDALYGRHNEWATTTSKTVKTKADRAEMKGRADAAQFLAHRIRALASTPAPASAQDELKRDAARWRAVIGCARLRTLGWAGLDMQGNQKPGQKHVHIGVEFWTHHDAGTDEIDRRAFTSFADAALSATGGAK